MLRRDVEMLRRDVEMLRRDVEMLRRDVPLPLALLCQELNCNLQMRLIAVSAPDSEDLGVGPSFEVTEAGYSRSR
jgi:hypothetical protein